MATDQAHGAKVTIVPRQFDIDKARALWTGKRSFVTPDCNCGQVTLVDNVPWICPVCDTRLKCSLPPGWQFDPLDEERGFLEDMLKGPDKQDLKLIFADWLEEHDQSDRA